VDISAPIANISGIVNPLPKDFMSAAQLLQEPCAVRARGGKSSSLVVKGRDWRILMSRWLFAEPSEVKQRLRTLMV